MKIIDSHIHIFDISRKLAWPPKDSVIYHSFLPLAYEKRAKAQGIEGAIVIEASPYEEDNDWVLEQISKLPFFRAYIGNLDLSSDNFRILFEKYSKHLKFVGVRIGNLWDRALALDKPQVLEKLSLVNEKRKILEFANPDLELLKNALKIKNKFLNQWIVLDHLPNLKGMDLKDKNLEMILKELASDAKVCIKFSAIAKESYINNRFDIGLYQEVLDFLYAIFKADKILFATDYPNSEFLGSFENICRLCKSYIEQKSLAEQELMFYKNAEKIYGR